MNVVETARYALKEQLATEAFERRLVTLRSGRIAEFYLDCRRVTLDAKGARNAGIVLADLAEKAGLLTVSAVGGPTLGADPLVMALLFRFAELGVDVRGFLVRKMAKEYGMGARIEGRFGVKPGSSVIVVEDVLTTGGSLIDAIGAVREEGFAVKAAMVLVDRNEGGRSAIESLGVPLIAAFSADEIDQLNLKLFAS